MEKEAFIRYSMLDKEFVPCENPEIELRLAKKRFGRPKIQRFEKEVCYNFIYMFDWLSIKIKRK